MNFMNVMVFASMSIICYSLDMIQFSSKVYETVSYNRQRIPDR